MCSAQCLPLLKPQVSKGILDGRLRRRAHLEGVVHCSALETLDGLGHQLWVDVVRRGVIVVRGKECEIRVLHLVVPERGRIPGKKPLRFDITLTSLHADSNGYNSKI